MNRLIKILRYFFIFLLGCLFFFGMGMSSFAYAQEKPLEHVKFMMEWYPSKVESYTPYVVAIDKGYFKEEGLEVELVPGKGSTVSVQIVAAKECNFGNADATTALIARSKGAPIVVLAVINQSPTVGVYSFKSANIKSPKDLIGKKVATELTSKKHAQFLGFLKKQGIDPDKITFIPITGGGELTLLLSGKVDATLGMITGCEPVLKAEKKDYNVMLLKDYGVNIYDNSIITNEEIIKNNPELVRRLVRAALKGVHYTIGHPQEAADIYLKYYSEEARSKRESVLLTLEVATTLIKNKVTEKYGIGYQTQEGWEATQNFAYEGGLIEKKIDIKEIYTNNFR